NLLCARQRDQHLMENARPSCQGFLGIQGLGRRPELLGKSRRISPLKGSPISSSHVAFCSAVSTANTLSRAFFHESAAFFQSSGRGPLGRGPNNIVRRASS